MTKEITDEDAEKFMWWFKALIVSVAVLFVVPLAIASFFLDRRLDTFEENLKHHPPQELEAGEFARGDLFHLAENPVEGQLVYVPAYSHVYHGDGKPNLLTITLSVRNTSIDSSIVVNSIRYFDTKGNQVKSYLENPVRLPTLGTTEVVVNRDDAKGGSGANFLVEWYSETPVTEPIIEAVMIDTSGKQGISFVRRGSVIGKAVASSPNRSE